MRAKLGAVVLGAAIFLGAHDADAALTSSEKGLIKEWVAASKVENAQKLRSLVARTDLTADESAAALGEGVSPVPFTDQRGVFLNEVVFGAASAPSRPVTALATVKALLARADTIYQRYVGGLDHEPKAIAELVAIYGWLDFAIANAGRPTSGEHDANAGIPVATYEECSKALRDHIEQNVRWLKGTGTVPATTIRLRAQAQALLVDMEPGGLTRRAEAADRLALKGARRSLLTDHGVLLSDSGKIDDQGAERVRQILSRLPRSRSDLSLICVEDGAISGPPLRARGQVVHVAPGPERYPFEGAAPGTYDPITSAIAHDLAVVTAMRTLDNRWSQIRLQADRDMVALAGDPAKVLGHPRGPSVEYVVGAAIHALLVDAPKTVELAAARATAGHPESMALLSDALGVLAAPVEGEKESGKVDLGKDGGVATATSLRFAPNGTVVQFKLDGHTWAIDRASPSYLILAVRRDGETIATGSIVSKSVIERGNDAKKPKK
jgi:hypothetical protein